nr:choice-of-anchor D domain-containing protein [Acidobacteriota bacterium]
TASWKFTNLVVGKYQVAATWTVASSRPTNAPYTVQDPSGTLAEVSINQTQLPNDFAAQGSNWETLATVDSLDGELEVLLKNQGDKRWFIADAVRIEKVGDVVLAPEIDVKLGATSLTDNVTVDLGSTLVGSPVTHTFTVENTGTSDMSLTLIDGSGLPAGLTLASNIGVTTLPRNQSTTFAVTVTAESVGTLNATLQLVNDDGDENPFDIPLTVEVAAAPQFQVIDNGDAGFTATSGFSFYGLSGRDGDLHYADVGGNDTASWKFTNLVVGKYQVAATWTVASSRPTNAPFTVQDPSGTLAEVSVNQTQLPNDFDAQGSTWETLATVDSLDGELEVLLKNQGDKRWFIADAIRIEKVGDVVLAPEIDVKLGATSLTD